MGDGDTAVLASCLDEKPLDGWMQADLGHISGLTACDAICFGDIRAVVTEEPDNTALVPLLELRREAHALGQRFPVGVRLE